MVFGLMMSTYIHLKNYGGGVVLYGFLKLSLETYSYSMFNGYGGAVVLYGLIYVFALFLLYYKNKTNGKFNYC